MTYLTRAEEALAHIRAQDRYRRIEPSGQRYVADFSTNDYLGLASDSRLVEAFRRASRVGSGGARLLGGRQREHELLEGEIAAWIGRERALLFSSGYLAAIGALGVLATLCERVDSDALNHASLVDGIRFTKTPREIYAHGALPKSKASSRGGRLVVSESLFSMDGDTVDVAALLAQLGEEDVLLLDEAHALGVLGKRGGGLACGIDDERIVILGTLGKAIGAAGGFIAGPAKFIELLVNRARTFIFDTAPPPAIALAARIGIMLAAAADDRRARLLANIERLHAGLRGAGMPVPLQSTPVVPIPCGSEARAMALMEHALERGVYAPAVRPPTVPPGGSRLRVSVRADHTAEQIDLLLERIASFECTATS